MTGFIRSIFSEVPTTYERVNHLMTFGLDRRWRRRAAEIAARDRGDAWIDLCTGTGEMTANLRRLAAKETAIYAVDFSVPMISVATAKPETGSINFVISDVGALPFPDNSFDLITMSFATRNINTSSPALVNRFR